MNDLEKLAKVVKNAKEKPKYYERSTNFCASKGNSLDFPENSSLAIKSVTRHHFTEFDINISKDGKWVVIDDSTVDRTTNGTGRVDSLTFSQLRALRIDSGTNINLLSDSEKIIPSLDEAINYCKNAGSVPFIEIKANTYTNNHLQELLNVLSQNKVTSGQCIICSFDKSILERLRGMSDEIMLSWMLNSVTQTELNECVRLKMSANVAYNHTTVTKEMANAFHNNGLQFNVWTAPDDAFQALKDKGVDIITTNSRSGDLRWSAVTLDNGFAHYSSGGVLRTPFVEEVSPGVARVTFTVSGGINTKDKRLLSLPEWAIPLYSSWHTCTIRTANGSALATVDVLGKLSGKKGDVVIGLDWGARTIWVNGSFTFDLY